MSQVNECYWPDSELVRFIADYDEVLFEFRTTSERVRRLSCRGYMALDVMPFWDEVVVESVQVDHNADLAQQTRVALERSGQADLPTGCPDRDIMQLSTLIIRLIDGCTIRVVASRFDVLGDDEDGPSGRPGTG